MAGDVWPKHIFDIGFLFGSRIAHAVTTATRGDSLASSPPPSAAKISLSCLFPTFLSLKGSLFTSLHPLSFPRSLLLMDYVSPSLSIYRLSLSLSISIRFLYRRSVYGVSQKRRMYDERTENEVTFIALTGESCQEFYEVLLFRNID